MPEVRPRARDLGIIIGVLSPGPLNAITDIAGVRVGHCTVWEGQIYAKHGSGPARTGVTATVPPGDYFGERLYAGCSVLNGCDSYLNDAAGFHIREEHGVQALEAANPGPVVEGTVGSAIGLHCFDFKGGIGTSSRQLPGQYGGYTVGVLVNTNFGKRHNLTIAGVPVGREIQDLMPGETGNDRPAEGSCIVVVATDAPLHPLGLQRLARRAGLGLALAQIRSSVSSFVILSFFCKTQLFNV